MISEDEFYSKWHDYFKKFTPQKELRKHGPHYEDDEYMDRILLIVTDDMPTQVQICIHWQSILKLIVVLTGYQRHPH